MCIAFSGELRGGENSTVGGETLSSDNLMFISMGNALAAVER